MEKRQVGESALLCMGVPGGAGNVGLGETEAGQRGLTPSLKGRRSPGLEDGALPLGSPGPARSGEHGGAHWRNHPGLWGGGNRASYSTRPSDKGHAGVQHPPGPCGPLDQLGAPYLLPASRAQCGGLGALGPRGAKGSSCPV